MEHARGRGCQGRETNEPDSLRGNISPLGRDASLRSSVAIIWFNVWTRLVLYILKRSPYFWRGRGRANFHHKDTRTVNIDLPDKWRTSCHKPLERLLSTAAFPFVGTECQVVSCAISCRSQILKRNKFRWTKSTFLCSATLSPPKSCWFWGCAHSQHLYFSIVCLPSPLWFFFLGLRIHSKYSNQWNRIFFLCWHYGREAAALGHLQQR